MEKLLETAQQLVASLRTKIADYDKQLEDLKAGQDKIANKTATLAKLEGELAAREAAVVGVEYSQDVVAKNEFILKSNQKEREFIGIEMKDLADAKVEFSKKRNTELAEIAAEREMQRRNTVAVQKLDQELKQKIAEYNARIKSIGA